MAKIPKLGRKKAHRQSLIRNLVTSLVLYEKIKTTQAKGKAIIPVFSKLMGIAQKGDLNARRKLIEFFPVKEAVTKIIESLAPRFKDSPVGFLKVYKIEGRKGDNAPMVILEIAIPPQKIKQDEKPKEKNRS